MSLSTDIKNKIKLHLDAMKTAGKLGEVFVDDFKKGIFDRDIAAYPAAILTTPSTESGVFSNRQNLRAFTFEVVIIMKADNITTTDAVETLIDNLLDEFDNDPTLGGTAHGALDPATTTPAPVPSKDESYILFSLILRAKVVKDLTF